MAMGDLDEDGMYNLKMTPEEVANESETEFAMSAIGIDLAHQRMMHRNTADIRLMTKCTNGLQLRESTEPCFCEGCAIGKAKRKSFPKERKPRIKDLCELVWFDTC